MTDLTVAGNAHGNYFLQVTLLRAANNIIAEVPCTPHSTFWNGVTVTYRDNVLTDAKAEMNCAMIDMHLSV